MSDVFVGQILLVPYSFAPKSFAVCAGQLSPISQNTALFSLLGTNYGGDGKSSFGLPNLQGAVPVGWGSGPGLTPNSLGETGGSTTVTLLQSQMTQHTHSIFDNAAQLPPPGGSPANSSPGQPTPSNNIYATGTPDVQFNANALTPAGSSQAHNNVMPSLGLNWVIALFGIYPPRT